MRIAVLARRKIGLPVAVQFALRGHDVTDVDATQRAVDMIRVGQESLSSGAPVQEMLQELVPAGTRRSFTHQREAIPGMDESCCPVGAPSDCEGLLPYGELSKRKSGVHSSGRLGAYRNPDTSMATGSALPMWRNELSGLSA